MTVEGYRAERDSASLYAHRIGQIRTFHGLS